MKAKSALTSMLLLLFISFLGVSHSSASIEEAIVVSKSNENIKIDASNKSVIIEGNSNTIYLTGDCKGLTIKGNGNVIETSVASIEISGSNNVISYSTDAAPVVINTGINNTVQKSVQAIDKNQLVDPNQMAK